MLVTDKLVGYFPICLRLVATKIAFIQITQRYLQYLHLNIMQVSREHNLELCYGDMDDCYIRHFFIRLKRSLAFQLPVIFSF